MISHLQQDACSIYRAHGGRAHHQPQPFRVDRGMSACLDEPPWTDLQGCVTNAAQ